MKKFIAIILVFIMIASLVACGGKKNETPNQAGGQTEAAAAGNEGTTGAEDATAEITDATATSTPDEDEVTATTPKDEGNKDDIKVPVDGDNDVPVESPEDGAPSDSDFVISFDELLDAN